MSLKVNEKKKKKKKSTITPVAICSHALMDIEARHAGRIPDDFRNCFNVLKKCQNKFDYLINEILLIKQLRPCLNVQSDSICAKVFV